MVSEFRSRYRAQALGVAWSLLSPIATMFVLNLVLGPTFGRPHYSMYLLLGLIVWSFVSSATNAAIATFVAKADIVKRSPALRIVLPVSVMASYVINLGIETLALLAFTPLVAGSVQLSWALLAVPAIVLVLVILLAGVALLGATLNALYRDVAYITSTALVFLFWLTPIVYPLDRVGEPYRAVLAANPLATIVEAIRGATMDGAWPSAQAWAIMVGSACAVLALGVGTFRRLEAAVLDHV